MRESNVSNLHTPHLSDSNLCSAHNTSAVAANLKIYYGRENLTPLHHYLTNEVILGFPATKVDLCNLDGR